MNLFSRFGLVFTPGFVQKLMAEKSQGRSWGFWFISNTFLTILACTVLWFWGGPALDNLKDEGLKRLPATFEIQLQDGKLSTKGIANPMMWESSDGVFLLDTEGKIYTEKSLDDYENAILITGDRFISKRNPKIEQFLFQEIKQDFTLTKGGIQDWITRNESKIKVMLLIAAFFAIWFVLCIVRLISALWWGLLFWGAGAIWKIKNWSFANSFYAAFHFMFVTILVNSALRMGGVDFRFSATLLFILLYGMNFWHIQMQGGSRNVSSTIKSKTPKAVTEPKSLISKKTASRTTGKRSTKSKK